MALVTVGLFGPPVQAGFFDLETKLTASDTGSFDRFGFSVAINGNTAIVGAETDDDGGSNSGSAYLFDISTGSQLAKLTADDTAEDDRFGISVAINGSTAIVGARLDDDGGSDTGSAYLFDITTGNQLAKLTASDAEAGDGFGQSVAISGNTAIIGARGDFNGNHNFVSAYLFDVTTGDQLAKLVPSEDDPFISTRFDVSVAISGNTALVSRWSPAAGSAYLFDVTTGSQIAKLTADDLSANNFDLFGQSVAISGNVAIVGAIGDDRDGTNAGTAYLFDATTGEQLGNLKADDPFDLNLFGSSVAISGNTAVVGAIGTRNGGGLLNFSAGSAYLFDVTTGQQLAKIIASDSERGDRFGNSVAISGNTVIVGTERNKAYLYTNVPEPSSILLAAIAELFGLSGRKITKCE